MDWRELMERIPDQIKKYRYVLLVILSGIILISIPGKSEHPDAPAIPEKVESNDKSLQDQLEEILAQVAGAGRVKVLLTQAAGEEILYQADEDHSTHNNFGNIRSQTVTVSDSSRTENGLVRQIIPPTYLGAVVLCEGAEKAAVRLAITEAVSSVTGLSFDKITVLKIK